MPTHRDLDTNEHPETLRPLADDVDPKSFVRPSRAPWVIGGIVLSVAAVAGLFAVSSRPKNLASVQAVLDEAHARQTDEQTRGAAQGAQPGRGVDEAAVDAKLTEALPAAGKSCGVTLQPGAHIDLRVTIAPDGTITRSEVTNPPFAMTELGTCIARRLATTRLPSFEGQDLVVTRALTLR